MSDISALGKVSSALSSPMSASAEKLLSQAKSAAGNSKKIDKASTDFESILIGNWLQGAEESFAKVPGTDEEEDNDSGGGQFLSMGMQSLSSALADSGGIGIAKMIAKQLHKTEDPAPPAEPTVGS